MNSIIVCSDKKNFESEPIWVRPQLGQDFYSYMFVSDNIYSLRKQKHILPAEDDRGLLARLKAIFPNDTKLTLLSQGVLGITFCCSEYSGRFRKSSYVNKVVLYDGIEGDKFIDESIFRAKIFTYLEAYRGLLLDSTLVQGIDSPKIYHPESNLYDGEGYHGLVARRTDNSLEYFLEDAFANISEPRYIADIEMTQLSPALNRIEDLIDQSLRIVNWDLVKTHFPHRESGKYQWITSLVLDQFYFDVLYYSVSKRLWLTEESPSDEILQGVTEEPILVDFAAVRRMLYQAIHSILGKGEYLQIAEETSAEEFFEEDDVSWIFNGEKNE